MFVTRRDGHNVAQSRRKIQLSSSIVTPRDDWSDQHLCDKPRRHPLRVAHHQTEAAVVRVGRRDQQFVGLRSSKTSRFRNIASVELPLIRQRRFALRHG